MKRSAGQLRLANPACICDPMDLAALGHMTNCPAHIPERPADQWIQTYTGRQYWPLDPSPDDVCVEDIAHHLGYICRFSGACTRFYSVAEHSTHVGHVVEMILADRGEHNRPLVLRAHLHDAAEFMPPHDVARPVKYADECTFLREVEARNEAAIFEALGIGDCSTADVALIKEADNAMLLAEQELIMAPAPADWASIVVDPVAMAYARVRMQLIPGARTLPDGAGDHWLHRYHELAG